MLLQSCMTEKLPAGLSTNNAATVIASGADLNKSTIYRKLRSKALIRIAMNRRRHDLQSRGRGVVRASLSFNNNFIQLSRNVAFARRFFILFSSPTETMTCRASRLPTRNVVFVVDDDASILKSLARLLRLAGPQGWRLSVPSATVSIRRQHPPWGISDALSCL